MPHQEYLERCARAWLTWSPEGYGWECFRHYEASLCRSVPILSQPGICRYQPLLDGRHAWYYRPEGESLREVVVKALADKAALESMARAACEHALRFHTQRRACDYILETVRGAGTEPDCA
ncbi:MAG: glycosyltransferase [Bryobacteraceae bacterium]|nr:glycosyltransferase [Bryobacteraceae bacterium]